MSDHEDQEGAATALSVLMDNLGLPGAERSVAFTGREQTTLSKRRIGSAAAIALGAYGASVNTHWRQRGGADQQIGIDIRRATQALYVAAHTRSSRRAGPTSGYGAGAQTQRRGAYQQTADGRWIDLVLGSRRPNQTDIVLRVLDCTLEDLPDAVRTWEGADLEDAIHKAGATAGLVRTAEEWRATPQGRHLHRKPVITIERIGEAAPRRRLGGARPLTGVRVLDATHVIAGPMVARTLAEQGADVIHVTRPVNHDTEAFLLDLGVGKRNTVIDLDSPDERDEMHALATEADVFVQSYRPGSLAARGFAPEELAAANPGIVVVSVSCFGETGPHGGRRGVDPVAQAVSGLSLDEVDTGDDPLMNMMVTLTDPLVGYLGAAGGLAALTRQAADGGSYLVRVSLVGSAMWLQDLGWSGGRAEFGQPLSLEHLITPRTISMESEHFGDLTYLAPVVAFSATPASWDRPPAPATPGPISWLP